VRLPNRRPKRGDQRLRHTGGTWSVVSLHADFDRNLHFFPFY
jgi:hypothetical protein